MFFLHLALFFLGTGLSIAEITVFSSKPEDFIYLKEGSDAVLAWDYVKTDDLSRVVYEVRNKTAGITETLRVEDENGTEIIDPRRPPPAYANRLVKKGRATLIIKDITFEDSTFFRCTLFGNRGTSISKVNLVVTGSCNVYPSVQFSEMGGSATFTCNATGVPGQNFSWTRKGETEKITSGAQHSVVSVTGSTQLTIKNISVGMERRYVCDGTVNINQPCSDEGFLQVLYLVQDESLPTSYNVTINGNETIYCPVRGYPPPSVTWKKDGILLPEFKTTKLTITFVKEEDLGIYTCLATDGKTALGPLSINVAKESDELELKFKKDGTEEDPASLGWSSEAKAKYYVVSITRKGVIRDDLVIGRKTSLELHYHTLVMENAGTKPEEIGVYADVSAMSDEKVIKKLPTQNLTIKKPRDTGN